MAQQRRILVNRAGCRSCGDVVTSASTHDCVSCRCGAIFVDGGTDYLRRGGQLWLLEELSEREPDPDDPSGSKALSRAMTLTGDVARDPAANRRVGCLIAQALGDALGFLVEGHDPRLCAMFVQQAFSSDSPPSFMQRTFGQYSDDTQLARELARSLVESRGWSPEDYARRIADLFATNRIVGRGRATQAAAERILAGAPWDRSGEPSPSAGNGAAMRAAPVGLIRADAPTRRRVADEQALITHLDLRSRAAAVLVSEVVADALSQPDPSMPVGRPEWFEDLARHVESLDPDLSRGLRAMPVWLAAAPGTAAAEIARAGDAPVGAAHAFERWHGISPFATPSALYAVYAYARTPCDAEHVMQTAVSVGGDVDTVAAMAGAMVGARVGFTGLSPRLLRWAEALTDQGDWGLTMLAALAASCGSVAASAAIGVGSV